MKKKSLILCLILSLFLSGCGVELGNSSSSDDDIASDNETTTTVFDESFNDNSNSGGDGRPGSGDCEDFGNDGPGGFLWKPVSEGDGNLVLLFPVEYPVEFASVTLEVIDEVDEETGEILETSEEFGEFDGYFEDGRQVWRFSMPGSEYTGEGFVDSGSEECTITVEDDPAERND